ncbi:hypothetical protein BKA83DRAFT_4309659 [Pisolithus microcarpus]|nr:hypothetical protein BKA83DRAFT_4309659 [Pisolithus microcarpus]
MDTTISLQCYQNKQKKDIAIEFFSNLFGLKYLKNYVGEITFVARFPSMMETSPVDVLFASAAKEDGLRVRLPNLSCTNFVMGYNDPFRDDQGFATTEPDPRLEAVLPLLLGRCESFCAPYDAPCRGHEIQRVEEEIMCISQTLGVDLVGHITTAFYNAYRERFLS